MISKKEYDKLRKGDSIVLVGDGALFRNIHIPELSIFPLLGRTVKVDSTEAGYSEYEGSDGTMYDCVLRITGGWDISRHHIAEVVSVISIEEFQRIDPGDIVCVNQDRTLLELIEAEPLLGEEVEVLDLECNDNWIAGERLFKNTLRVRHDDKDWSIVRECVSAVFQRKNIEEQICEACEGTGLINYEKICENCNGLGVIFSSK